MQENLRKLLERLVKCNGYEIKYRVCVHVYYDFRPFASIQNICCVCFFFFAVFVWLLRRLIVNTDALKIHKIDNIEFVS